MAKRTRKASKSTMGKKGRKAKGRKGKAKKKRKLPAILKAWQQCREEVGAEPFKKMSKSMKRKAQACVDKKIARKKK